MEPRSDFDVIVIGAGPGGSSAAIRLAALGYKVAIIERAAFPREHVGICLSLQTTKLLEYLGVGHAFLSAGFWPRRSTAVRWRSSETELVPQPGYHVRRDIFDQLLLNRACDLGVTVFQPAIIIDLQCAELGHCHITIREGEGETDIAAKYIVDAAGRRGVMGRKRVQDSPSLIALHAKWSLGSAPEFDGLIESGDKAWLWYAQVAQNDALVSFYCDPRSLKSNKQDNLQGHFEHLLKQFSGLKAGQLKAQSSQVTGCDASSHHAEQPMDDYSICVGDALLSVDPLSSQGVHLALQSGIQGAVMINTFLKKPANTDLAKSFYSARLFERVARYSAKTRIEYSRAANPNLDPFWIERGQSTGEKKNDDIRPTDPHPLAKLKVSKDAVIKRSAVIIEDFVEETQVLSHPKLETDVAYLSGHKISDLLEGLPDQFTFDSLHSNWENRMAESECGFIATWFWRKGILAYA
ncbi:FAD-dependent monooxygenase [Hellea sp.]|nr:FAD-dependent monooxygenase [Hellea sp.]